MAERIQGTLSRTRPNGAPSVKHRVHAPMDGGIMIIDAVVYRSIAIRNSWDCTVINRDHGPCMTIVPSDCLNTISKLVKRAYVDTWLMEGLWRG